jgi:murein DD-endopeptidase MepM/ murein hydrolase activator NlpD
MFKKGNRIQIQIYSKGTNKPQSYSIPLKRIGWWLVGFAIIIFGFIFWLPGNMINLKNIRVVEIANEQKAMQLTANKLEKQIAEANSQIESGRSLREKINQMAGLSAGSEKLSEKTAPKKKYKNKELSTDFEHIKKSLETFKNLRDALLADKQYANSLPLLHPVKQHQNITNRFGLVQDPLTKKELPHRGLDFAVGEGDTVIATGDGIVESTFRRSYGFGNTLEIQHTQDVKTVYSHLQNILVQNGKPVQKGQPIATAGKSGSVPWSVLHYEVRYNDQPINPEDYFITP